MDFKELFEFAVAHDASDIHIQAGAPPMLRIGGQVRSVESQPLSDEAVREFIASIASPRERERLQEAAARGLDFSHVIQVCHDSAAVHIARWARTVSSCA